MLLSATDVQSGTGTPPPVKVFLTGSIVLKPFKDATELLSKEKNPTVSLIMPVITLLRNMLTSSSVSSSVKKMKAIMLKDFNNRFANEELQSFIAVSAFLDPRFKSLSFLEDDSVKNQTISTVKQVLFLQEVGPSTGVKQEPEPEPPLPTLGPEFDMVPPDSKRTKTEDDESLADQDSKKGSFFMDLFITKVEPAKSKDELITKEVDRYLNEDIQIPINPDGSPAPEKFDVLRWWQQRVQCYPRLATLARQQLCCPATSVPSERLFSSAGNLITKKRCCLKPENVDKLLFLHKNWSC